MQLRFLFLSSFSLNFIDSELGRNGKGRRVHPLIQYLGLFQGRTNRRAWSALASDLLWSPIPPLDAPDCSKVSPLYISFALDLLCLLGLHKIVITLLKTTALTYSSGHMGPSFNPPETKHAVSFHHSLPDKVQSLFTIPALSSGCWHAS